MKDAKRELTLLTDPSEVPEEMSEAEARDFWDAHEVTDTYLAQSGLDEKTAAELPPVRAQVASQSINLRLETSTLRRLKALAARRQMGYQTLLKTFLAERLYEEEKRDGLL